MRTNIFLASFVVAGVLTFSSCEDFLTESDPNHIVTNNFFSTEDDVERAVNGAYLALRSGSCMGEGSTAYTEERSDNAGRWDNQSAAGEPFQFTDFSLLAGNTYLKSHWTAMFETVNNANFAIKGAEEITFADADDQTAQEKKQNAIAEARFVRALVYFDIVRKWGDAPLVTEYLSTPDQIEGHTFREDKSLIYDLIVQDLKFGLEQSTLPNHQDEGGKGRASKAAMAGLLGKVYLTMAHDLDDGKRNEYLNNANTYLEQCYNMKEFGSLSEISLDPENTVSGVFNVANKSECPEILFQIVYRQGDKDYHSSIAVDTQPVGVFTNSQCKTSQVPMLKVTPDLVKEFETVAAGYGKDDPRLNFFVGSAPSCYYVTKFRDKSEAAGTLGYGGNDWIILRYADVILMLAEVNEALGNTDEAIGYLDQVRARAGLDGYETASLNTAYSSKFPTLKLAILHERRVELAFENQRWYDLLRFFTPSELVDYMHSKNQDDYNESNLQNFTETDVLYPIPYDEWLLNPEGMYQNDGY